MPFLRFTRDKRGYEHTYLVQSTNKRGKPIRPRILYWYRTPPGVKLGRSPFDEEVRKTLEANNPGVAFDWPTIVNTPFPPPDPAEMWRERRKAEKLAKQARREMEQEEAAAAEADPAIADAESAALVEPPLAPLEDAEAEVGGESLEPLPLASEESAVTPEGAAPAGAPSRKRRRRGGRRRRARTQANGVVPPADGGTDAPADASAPNEPDATEEDESEADE